MGITTQSQLKDLLPREKRYNKGCGGGLIVCIEPVKKGGGKSFIGRRKGKDVRIGIAGSNPNEYTLKTARDEWNKIQRWAISNQTTVNEYKKTKKITSELQYTVGDIIDDFLKHKKMRVKETTLREYRMKLNNQVLTLIDRNTPIEEMEWSNGGRRKVMKVIDKVRANEKHDLAHRCHSLLDQTFRHAINKGLMKRGENPAEKIREEIIKHRPKHHCSITWNEVPQFLREVNLNKPNAQIQTVLATKFLLMTFLRAGALVRLRWDWIDRESNLITIDGNTSGLKRYKDLADHIPHHIPLTNEMKKVLDLAREFSGHKEHVFQPLMQGRSIYPHLSPSAPNDYLKNLGYKDRLRAHGWRTVALTYGQDELGVSSEIIQRQMGHLPHKKGVRGHYDQSLRLDERKEFLDKWCSALTSKGLDV